MKRINIIMSACIALLLSLPGCCWSRSASDCKSCDAPRKERKSCKSCPMNNGMMMDDNENGREKKRVKKSNHNSRYKSSEGMNGEDMMMNEEDNSIEFELK